MRSTRKTYTTKVVEAVRDRLIELGKAPAPRPTLLGKSTLVVALKGEIEALYSRGYTAKQIAGEMGRAGAPVSVSLLKLCLGKPTKKVAASGVAADAAAIEFGLAAVEFGRVAAQGAPSGSMIVVAPKGEIEALYGPGEPAKRVAGEVVSVPVSVAPVKHRLGQRTNKVAASGVAADVAAIKFGREAVEFGRIAAKNAPGGPMFVIKNGKVTPVVAPSRRGRLEATARKTGEL